MFLGPSSIPLAVTALGMILLGLGVLLWERASRESRAFLGLCVAIVVWQVGFAGMYSAPEPEEAMAWAKAAYLGIPLIPPALLAFTRSVLRIHRGPATIVVGAWIVGAVFVGAFLLDLIIVGMQRYSWGFYPRYGAAGIPYLLFFCGTLAVVMWEFGREHRAAGPGVHRARIRWLMIGFGVAYFAVLDYLPVFGVELYPFGFIPILVFLGITAWTIGRYRLVDLTPSHAADQILATMADPLIVVDAGRRIHIVNEAACEVLGTNREKLLGIPVESLCEPESEDAASLVALCHAGVTRDRQMTLRHRSGVPIEVSVSASPLLDASDERAGTVVIARDMRDRIRSERALRESEERLRSLIENIMDAILVSDVEGTIQFASPSVERVLGYRPEERLGTNILDHFHPEDREEIRRAMREGGPSLGHTVTGEYRVRHKDGSWRIVEATVTNLVGEPAVNGIIVAYHDVTERRDAEAALRESEEQLRQAQRMEAVGRLAGGVAHDFNNLLTVINGQTQLLLEGVFEPEEERAALEEVAKAGGRAAALTRQLLAFSRKQVLQPQLIDVNDAAADMDLMLRRLIGEDVQIETHLGRDLYRVEADPGQIEQVLLNLVVNARDAMPQGGQLTISTSNVILGTPRAAGSDTIEAGDYVCLSVEDTGEGIPAEIQSQIFEPFFTTKELGKGTGLGLSTVYGIVKQSGGWVEFDTTLGVGTVFRVFLPRAATDVDLGLDPGSDRPSQGARARRDLTVLLVEDDPAVRAFVRRLLERDGMQVVEAEHGKAALTLASEGDAAIDLLITDVVMPEMSGRELADRLRERQPRLAVLYMSGYTDDALGSHGVLEPGMTFLPKPFGPLELRRAVGAAVRKGRSRGDPPPGLRPQDPLSSLPPT